jgi:hypothetical protein
MKYFTTIACVCLALFTANMAEATVFGRLFSRQNVRVQRVVNHHQQVVVQRIVVPQRQRVVEFC